MWKFSLCPALLNPIHIFLILLFQPINEILERWQQNLRYPFRCSFHTQLFKNGMFTIIIPISGPLSYHFGNAILSGKKQEQYLNEKDSCAVLMVKKWLSLGGASVALKRTERQNHSPNVSPGHKKYYAAKLFH